MSRDIHNVCAAKTRYENGKEGIVLRAERKQRSAAPRRSPIPRETAEIVDRGEMMICGVTGIDEYCPCYIRIRTTRGAIGISGCALTLCWAGEKRLLLRGLLTQIEFFKK